MLTIPGYLNFVKKTTHCGCRHQKLLLNLILLTGAFEYFGWNYPLKLSTLCKQSTGKGKFPLLSYITTLRVISCISVPRVHEKSYLPSGADPILFTF